MINIKCPNCDVRYSVYKIETNKIQCKNCGAWYHQGFFSENMLGWVYKLAYNIRNYGK